MKCSCNSLRQQRAYNGDGQGHPAVPLRTRQGQRSGTQPVALHREQAAHQQRCLVRRPRKHDGESSGQAGAGSGVTAHCISVSGRWETMAAYRGCSPDCSSCSGASASAASSLSAGCSGPSCSSMSAVSMLPPWIAIGMCTSQIMRGRRQAAQTGIRRESSAPPPGRRRLAGGGPHTRSNLTSEAPDHFQPTRSRR